MEAVTIIEQFILKTTRSYEESIGLSKKKYAAAIACIMDTSLMTVVKKIEGNYKVLRKWRTEDKFKSVTKQAAIACAEFIGKWMLENIQKRRTVEEWLAILSNLKDMDFYGKAMKEHLRKKVEPILAQSAIQFSRTKMITDIDQIHKIDHHDLLTAYFEFGLREEVNKFDVRSLFDELTILLREKLVIERTFKLVLEKHERLNTTTNLGDSDGRSELESFLVDDFDHHYRRFGWVINDMPKKELWIHLTHKGKDLV